MRSTTFITLLSFVYISLALPSTPQARTITLPITKLADPVATEDKVLDFENHMRHIARRYSGEPLSKRDKVVSANLDKNAGGSLWKTDIMVGTPPEKYSVCIDTGSADLYLPHSDCTTCGTRKPYDNTKSSTSVAVGDDFTLKYGDGSVVEGQVYKDVVAFGGAQVKDLLFGAATSYQSSNGLKTDGLLGLSFPSSTHFDGNTLLKSLKEGGQIDKMMFGAKFAAEGSEITLGGANSKLYKGSIFKSPVTSSSHWAIELQSVNVNGRPVVESKSAIIDSGANVIVGDASSVKKLYDSIPGSAPEPNWKGIAEGIYSVPCDPRPTFSLAFGGKSFTLPEHKAYLANTGNGRCIGAITSAFSTAKAIKGGWVVGSTFLENVYSVFDMSTEPATVGFAELS